MIYRCQLDTFRSILAVDYFEWRPWFFYHTRNRQVRQKSPQAFYGSWEIVLQSTSPDRKRKERDNYSIRMFLHNLVAI